MAQRIGIVGVGRMGQAMAENLLAKGYAVTGYRRGPMDALAAAGGVPAASPADVARNSDIVITSLPGNEALEDVLSRADGLLTALGPGQVVIETTSLSPAEKRRHAERIAATGAVMLDCPVSGTPAMTKMGRGAFFASGDRETAESCRDLMELVAGKMTWVGDVGAGAAVKSVATALVAIHTLAAAEGLAIAAREGGDLEAVHAAISASPAGSAMFELRGALMAKRDYSDGAGSIEGYLRGLERTYAEVRDAGPTPLLALTRDWYRAAVDAGHTGTDQARIFEYLMSQS